MARPSCATSATTPRSARTMRWTWPATCSTAARPRSSAAPTRSSATSSPRWCWGSDHQLRDSPPPCGEGSGVGVPERTPGALLKSDRADASAKRMRREPTYAEKRLWKALRTIDLHFRRQAPFGPYIVDFVCHEHRLIVELDGGIHDLAEVAARDVEREAWLTGRGYRVMRFRNEELPDDVLYAILVSLGAVTPTPNPSPQGGGEFAE